MGTKTEYKIDDLESVSEGMRNGYIEDHIRTNVESEVMRDISWNTYLFWRYNYFTKKQDDNLRAVFIDLEYTRLSAQRVGYTWGFELKGEKQSKKFEFEVRESPNESPFRYTVERKY